MIQTTLDDIIRKTIVAEVKKGKTKMEVGNELGYSCYIVAEMEEKFRLQTWFDIDTFGK